MDNSSTNMQEVFEKVLEEIQPTLEYIAEKRREGMHPGQAFQGIIVLAEHKLEGTDATPDDVVRLAQLIWAETTPDESDDYRGSSADTQDA